MLDQHWPRELVPGSGTIKFSPRLPLRIPTTGTTITRALAGPSQAMPPLETFIGATAALLSSLSYVPQVKKVWAGQPTDDLSLRTLMALTVGLALWVTYGAFKADWIIVASNLVGAALTGFVLYRKLRAG